MMDNLVLAERKMTEIDKEEQQQKHTECTVCGEEIYKGESFYDIDDEHVCDDCILEWVSEFRTYA